MQKNLQNQVFIVVDREDNSNPRNRSVSKLKAEQGIIKATFEKINRKNPSRKDLQIQSILNSIMKKFKTDLMYPINQEDHKLNLKVKQ